MAVIRRRSTVLFLFGLLLFYSETVLSDLICVGDEHSDDYSAPGPKPNCSRLVSNLVEATQEIAHHSTIMLLRGEEVISLSVIMIENLVNINVTSIKSTRIVCDQHSVGSGITFINVTNLTLSHITVESCGALHNVSYVTDKGKPEYNFSSAVYLENCTNIDIGYIEVSDSYGTGLCIFNSNGFITIHHSLFINNTVINGSVDTSELLLGGGGIYFELSECSPQWEDCDPYSNTYNINNTININNCIIAYNSVLADPDSIQFTNFRGGGLIFWIRGTSKNNTAVIEDSIFEGNTGLYGGGLFVQFYGKPTNNSVTIKNITSKDNVAELGGGGIDLGYYSFRPHLNRHNNITVISSIIMNNKAIFGGGNAFFSTLVTNTDPNNRVEFYDTLWRLNRAAYGSAVYLEPVINDVPANSFFPIPHFTNCNFTQNFIIDNESDSSAGVSVSSVGAGA
uniref:Right handed beta helix domain-containing protein n=1 Tax=Amphimedon queenslandica TaxID=400682 RepID=A0A1X7SVD6_AMPQE